MLFLKTFSFTHAEEPITLPPPFSLIDLAGKLRHEINPHEIVRLKENLYERIFDKNIDFFYENNALLSLLNTYYAQRASDEDNLCNLLKKIANLILFVDASKAILQLRWPEKHIRLSAERCKQTISSVEPDQTFFLRIGINCQSIAEATLVADFLEAMLKSNYGVHYRSGSEYGSLQFQAIEPEGVAVYLEYNPSCYSLVTHAKPDISKITDKDLVTAFCDPMMDYDDYHLRKYGIEDTRHYPSNVFSQHAEVDIVKKTLFEFGAIVAPSNEQLAAFEGRILCVTAIVLGSGNYMNARLTIEGLSKLMPKMQIDWLLADNGRSIPPSTSPLPKQVTLYQTSELWRLYPLIRSLSLKADMILGLPDNFLWSYECQLLSTRLNLSDHACYVLINEYNYSYDPQELPNYPYVNLDSGIMTQPSPRALGIIHPETIDFPMDLESKRIYLSRYSKTKQIFSSGRSTDPLYFGYAYAPAKQERSSVEGLSILDIFALFVLHAQLCKRDSIYVVLPLTVELIQEACEEYASIFKDCSIHYQNDSLSTSIHHGTRQYSIHVTHLFPFSNVELRGLMNYAAAWDTPVVATGDQSIIELFFSMSDALIFCYQLLWHKKPLFDQFVAIADNAGLEVTKALLIHIQKGSAENTQIKPEQYITQLAAFITSNQVDLKRESLIFISNIKSQPDLIKTLSKVICASVSAQRELAEVRAGILAGVFSNSPAVDGAAIPSTRPSINHAHFFHSASTEISPTQVDPQALFAQTKPSF